MMKLTFLILTVTVACISPVGAKNDKQEGHWGPWGPMSPCSVTCGSGIISMERTWIQAPDEAPYKIPFTTTQSYPCTDETYPECPQNGSWSGWAVWAGCSKACGNGVRERHRECRGQTVGGRPCEGEKFSKEDCNRDPCPPLPKNLNLTECQEDTNYTCVSQKMCIQIKQKCDGTVQCHDGSDEEDCPIFARKQEGNIRYDLSRSNNQSTFSSNMIGLTALMIVVAVLQLINH